MNKKRIASFLLASSLAMTNLPSVHAEITKSDNEIIAMYGYDDELIKGEYFAVDNPLENEALRIMYNYRDYLNEISNLIVTTEKLGIDATELLKKIEEYSTNNDLILTTAGKIDYDEIIINIENEKAIIEPLKNKYLLECYRYLESRIDALKEENLSDEIINIEKLLENGESLKIVIDLLTELETNKETDQNIKESKEMIVQLMSEEIVFAFEQSYTDGIYFTRVNEYMMKYIENALVMINNYENYSIEELIACRNSIDEYLSNSKVLILEEVTYYLKWYIEETRKYTDDERVAEYVMSIQAYGRQYLADEDNPEKKVFITLPEKYCEVLNDVIGLYSIIMSILHITPEEPLSFNEYLLNEEAKKLTLTK